MLSKQDLLINLKAIKLLARFHILPVSVEEDQGRVKFQRKKEKRANFIFKAQIVFYFVFAILYKSCRLIQSIWDPRYFKRHSFCINFMYVLGSLLNFYVVIAVVYLKGDEFAYLLTNLHGFKALAKDRFRKGGKLKPLNVARNLVSNELREIAIITHPLVLSSVAFAIVLIVSLDYRASHHILALVPECCQNPIIFIFATAIEATLAILHESGLYVGTYQILSFVPHIRKQLGGRTKVVALVAFKEAIRQLVRVELEIRLFNNVYATFNYLVKLTLLTLSISGIFTGIRFNALNPLLFNALLFIGLYDSIIFTFLYGRIYEISESVETRRNSLLTKAEVMKKLELKRTLRSIPYCGIRAGSFYVLDRMTALTFIYFVTTQVCTLLITFK